EAVDLIGHAGDAEEHARRPTTRVARFYHKGDEDRDQEEPCDGERVGQLRERCRDCAGGHPRQVYGGDLISWRKRRNPLARIPARAKTPEAAAFAADGALIFHTTSTRRGSGRPSRPCA